MMILQHHAGAENAAREKAHEALKNGNTESGSAWVAIANLINELQGETNIPHC
ncbi:MAG TPA: hypothetical protein VHZ32_03295 [Rhizomicrobium sp.]|nr:hypothetical protein [Rhizomicrobium sp.]